MPAHRWVARLILLVLAGCGDVGASRAPVVYVTDDRIEVYQAPPGVHRTIAESAIAIQLNAVDLDLTDASNVRITYTQTLGEAHRLCTDVAFQDQIEPGYCSGTLIDDRHIMTAGHCVATTADCDGATYPWILGFYYEAAGVLHTLTMEDVYYCTRTVAYLNDTSGDYAVIELDRPVVGHTPVTIGTAGGGTAVTMIGHPNGIRMKIAGNASILRTSGIDLYADVDAFFGNSGSGVFDDTGDVIGILVAGAPRDWRSAGGGCREIFVIDPVTPDEGETLTNVNAALGAFCATGVSSPVCTGFDIDAGMPDDAGMPPTDAGSDVDAGELADGGSDAGSIADACIRGGDHPSTSPGAAWRGRNFREGAFMSLTLSFLGLGFPPDIPTWGRILYDAKDNLDFAPHWAIFPGTAIFLTVLSINYIGDGLRDALDPRKVLGK